MTTNGAARLVTVFGGSGFVGRYVVRALAKRGHRVRVAVRRPDLAGFLQPMGGVGQIAAVQANVRDPTSVGRAIRGADHAVNLVGILFERGASTFDAVQRAGARTVAEACRNAGVRLIHVSAIGADSAGRSDYARTKGMAENAVRELAPETTILRPSIVFGPEDGFFNKFAEMARFAPALPLIGGGHTRFQPVYAGDVAEAAARCVEGAAAPGKTFELGGPDVMSFRQCLEMMLKAVGRRRAFVSIPFGMARLMGRTFSLAPFGDPPLTHDQVLLLESDNVVCEAAAREGRTLGGLGIAATALNAVLPSYMVRFRPAGQFARLSRD